MKTILATSSNTHDRNTLPMNIVLLPIPQKFRYRSRPQSQLQSETARQALMQCAEKIGAPRTGWEKDNNNVPKPLGKYHWSVTHKQLWCAAVIADKNVGIDVEAIVPRRKFHYQALGELSEWKLLGEQNMQTFYQLWTAKEAVLKANGSGIGYLLDCRLESIEDAQHMSLSFQNQLWRVEHFDFDNHLVAVTCDDQRASWHIETVI